MGFSYKSVFRLISLSFCIYGMIEDYGGEKYEFVFFLYKPPQFLQLTQLSLLLVALINIYGLFKKQIEQKFGPKIKKIHEILVINTLGVTSLVFIAYWILYFINPSLIIIKEVADLGYKPPFFKNFTQHIFPIIPIIYEFIKVEDNMMDAFLLIPLSILYYLISCYYFLKRERWQYNLLNVNNITRILLFTELTLISLIIVEIFCLTKATIKKYKLIQNKRIYKFINKNATHQSSLNKSNQ